jgi:hypothetical protein
MITAEGIHGLALGFQLLGAAEFSHSFQPKKRADFREVRQERRERQLFAELRQIKAEIVGGVFPPKKIP